MLDTEILDRFIPKEQQELFALVCSHKSDGFKNSSESFVGTYDELMNRFSKDGLQPRWAKIYKAAPVFLAMSIHANKYGNKNYGKSAGFMFRRSGYCQKLLGANDFKAFTNWLITNGFFPVMYIYEIAEMVRTVPRYTTLADVFWWRNDSTLQYLLKIKNYKGALLHIDGYNPKAPEYLIHPRLLAGVQNGTI